MVAALRIRSLHKQHAGDRFVGRVKPVAPKLPGFDIAQYAYAFVAVLAVAYIAKHSPDSVMDVVMWTQSGGLSTATRRNAVRT